VYRRILVKGSSGAGKSTLAAELALLLRLPYVELDALHHGPNWAAASAEELQSKVRAELDDAHGWVVDGNYDAKLGTLIMDRAELVVWLDLPLLLKLLRTTRRTLRRWFDKEVIYGGNVETLRGAFWGRDALLTWAFLTHFRHRQQWPAQLLGRNLVRLRTPREVQRWLAEFSERARRESGGASTTSHGSPMV
jgi:energy-coupling factor transporter ATP-binding protein EcfA2